MWHAWLTVTQGEVGLQPMLQAGCQVQKAMLYL